MDVLRSFKRDEIVGCEDGEKKSEKDNKFQLYYSPLFLNEFCSKKLLTINQDLNSLQILFSNSDCLK